MSHLAKAVAELKDQNDRLTRERQRLALRLTAATERAERAEQQLADRNICEHCTGPLYPPEPEILPTCPACYWKLHAELKLNTSVGSPDDDQNITDDWLRSIGFKDWDGADGEGYSYSLFIRMHDSIGWECRLAYQSNGFYAFRMCDPDVEEGLVAESVELMGRRNMRPTHTRGDVRLLCRALGIKLNESAPAVTAPPKPVPPEVVTLRESEFPKPSDYKPFPEVGGEHIAEVGK